MRKMMRTMENMHEEDTETLNPEQSLNEIEELSDIETDPEDDNEDNEVDTRRIEELYGKRYLLKGQGCLQHLLNLAIQDSIKKSKELAKIFDTVSAIIKFTHKPNVYKELKIKINYPTRIRWTSYIDSLEKMINNWNRIITAYNEEQKGNKKINTKYVVKLTIIFKMMLPLRRIIKKMESVEFYLGYFWIWYKDMERTLTNIESHADIEWKECKQIAKCFKTNLQQRIEKNLNFDKSLFVTAVFLNPHSKSDLTMYEINTARDKIRFIYQAINKHFNPYKQVNKNNNNKIKNTNGIKAKRIIRLEDLMSTEEDADGTKKDDSPENEPIKETSVEEDGSEIGQQYTDVKNSNDVKIMDSMFERKESEPSNEDDNLEEEMERYINSSSKKTFKHYWRWNDSFKLLKRVAMVMGTYIISNGDLERIFSSAKFLSEGRKNRISVEQIEHRLKAKFNTKYQTE
jgi:hypothetical protein